MGTIFVAGAYGVGKSTLCNALSHCLGIPSYSAGDLISQINSEEYGINKGVQNKERNQDILVIEVAKKLKQHPMILLAGHFCIFDKYNCVDRLPNKVFEELQMEQILLLEANVERIIRNLNIRDGKQYTRKQVTCLLAAEYTAAERISQITECPLYVHRMTFDETDLKSCLKILKREV